MRNPFPLLLAAALIACSDSSSGPGDTRPTSDLNFLRPAPDAPPLANPTVTFAATRGDNAEATIWYRPRPGESDSARFLEFKIPGDGLARRPDGTPIGEGETVQITINVVDPSRLIVQLEPSGLRFSTEHPAEMRIWFAETDNDLDGDGDVDFDDVRREEELALWRQEQAGQPWVRLGSLLIKDLEEVRADLTGFTNYVVAY